MSEFKISLAAARVNARLTQKEVANLLGVSNKTLINWEQGKVTPNVATIHMLSDLYRIPADKIFLPSKTT